MRMDVIVLALLGFAVMFWWFYVREDGRLP